MHGHAKRKRKARKTLEQRKRTLEDLERLMKLDLGFYKNRIVFVSGHTGFKGTWLCKILINAGAKVVGYSLEPPTNPNLFSLSKIESQMKSIIGDIRDYEKLKSIFDKYQPEIVFHLAAQPIVRDSYLMPRYTYETNVMGTCNVLECIRLTKLVKSFLNVTTDKVYDNNDVFDHAFKETEPLDGYDPYSNSKSCSELVTHSYKKSFFSDDHCAISTARAGNVIGGGDFANDRIIPDAIRAIEKGENVFVRNPNSTRPYEHVLEPLYVYLLIAEIQYYDAKYAGYYNIGPDDNNCITTGELMNKFTKAWGNGLTWYTKDNNGPHEANFLKLDCTKLKKTFEWKPSWHIDQTISKIVEWTKVYLRNPEDIPSIMDKQIKDFLEAK
jgi:CDP-glucose 4,6-dehydratase